ncbi:MAG: sigma 54-interacting transcriptional regulator [Planctomycetes bacterium]|nr:sigma 54-interacting transcriptional regulator [Planctomycetota bacterium]
MTQTDNPRSSRRIDEVALEALLEASTVINGTLDLDAVLQAIAQQAAEVLRAEASSVILLDRTRRKLVFRAAVGEAGKLLLGEEFDAGLGIAGRVVTNGEPILVARVDDHPEFFSGIDKKSRFVTRGMVAAPLRTRGQVLGVVEVINKQDGPQFDEHDVDILQVFANLAAIGCANAQIHEELKRENFSLREVGATEDPIVGNSAALRSVLQLCDRVAATNATVLLLGETGTGKELSARRVHAMSPRRDKPFVAINCAALPETRLESELCGHEAGAFTGATARKLGRFELADGGTLFLDEIGDISPSTQIKLLRVLQEREFVRVGGTKTIGCDVRIIAATNRDLKKAMETGEFREDLFYRLNVFPIQLPPLRDRREDIPKLVETFVTRFAAEEGRRRVIGADRTAMALLEAYDWPGNVRQLENAVFRAVVLSDGDLLGVDEFPQIAREVGQVAVLDRHRTVLTDEGRRERAAAEVAPVRIEPRSRPADAGMSGWSPSASGLTLGSGPTPFGFLRSLDGDGHVRDLA